MKQFLKLCEDQEYEICDELYEAYGTVLGKAEQLDDKCYKTYTLVRKNMQELSLFVRYDKYLPLANTLSFNPKIVLRAASICLKIYSIKDKYVNAFPHFSFLAEIFQHHPITSS